ncbi:unnamed protein product [Pseudo-nitzschia multistriata]|uniref:Uncharacterized protein n=1 Tax=Pseudo-nitzschia multistriata TaxID=183589 RepID=A0A448Z5P8_9STRA|nr:unnamed protein product [Pseudo-nitzschia multistriata]
MDEEEYKDTIPEKVDAAKLFENSQLSELLAKASSRSATDGLGPTPSQRSTVSNNNDSDWEWDGTVDEDAHLGLD